MLIWDTHTHFSGVTGDTPEKRIAILLRIADMVRVDRICLSMGLNWAHDPSPEQMRQSNDEVLRAISYNPKKVFGFVYLSPKHLEFSLEELERCVNKGPMVGVKLWVAMRCNAPQLDPIVQRAAELKAIILQHTYVKTTGNLPGESTPSDLAELAARHPQANFICGHTGGNIAVGVPAIRGSKNVYADLCGSDPVAGMTELAVRELGAERVLYGSDAGGRSFASQLGKVFGAQITEREKELILGENLNRLLTPILEAKGVKL